jgi:hypothetical protein
MAMVFKCDRCGEIYNYTPPDVNGNRKSNAVIFIDNTPSGEQWRCDDQVEAIQLCPSCMKQLNDWLTPDEQKPDTGNKNKWNSMNVQPQCGEAVEIKFENGDLDLAYRKYADKRWFQSSGEWVASDSKIVAWRYLY